MSDPLNGKNELFVILGSEHELRLESVWQIVDYLHYHGEKVTLCLHEDEAGLPDSKSKERALSKGLEISTWAVNEGDATFRKYPDSDNGRTVLFLGHGKKHLVDTIEALSLWLPKANYELQRVITWVDSLQYNKNQNAVSWYECCFHFSDLVILDNFKELPLSWLKEIKEHFKSQCFPCIIENTKKGRLQNLNVIIDNQVRRISQVFEFPETPYIEYEIDGDDDEDEDLDGEDGLERPYHENYFERLIDGKRSKPVPEF